jgi:hypothetical protein
LTNHTAPSPTSPKRSRFHRPCLFTLDRNKSTQCEGVDCHPRTTCCHQPARQTRRLASTTVGCKFSLRDTGAISNSPAPTLDFTCLQTLTGPLLAVLSSRTRGSILLAREREREREREKERERYTQLECPYRRNIQLEVPESSFAIQDGGES